MDSPFEVLAVDPDASDEAIERAYRRRVKDVHPDQGGSAEEFRAVRAAYEAATSGGSFQHEESADGRGQRPRRSQHATGTGGPMGSDSVETGEPGSTADPTTGADEVDAPDDQGAADDASPREVFDVAYLNYEVVSDYGWAIDQDDLFETAGNAGLAQKDYGSVVVEPDESLLEAAERRGFAWPYACRGGACANCAVAVLEGDMGLPVDHILPEEMTGRGIRLSCVGAPITDDTKVVYNVKHLPDLEDLRLPPHPFDRSTAGD